MATSGSGTRGTFAFSVALPAGSTTGKLTVWDASAENGAALHTVGDPAHRQIGRLPAGRRGRRYRAKG